MKDILTVNKYWNVQWVRSIWNSVNDWVTRIIDNIQYVKWQANKCIVIICNVHNIHWCKHWYNIHLHQDDDKEAHTSKSNRYDKQHQKCKWPEESKKCCESIQYFSFAWFNIRRRRCGERPPINIHIISYEIRLILISYQNVNISQIVSYSIQCE